jgi:hypothetical protein
MTDNSGPIVIICADPVQLRQALAEALRMQGPGAV